MSLDLNLFTYDTCADAHGDAGFAEGAAAVLAA